MYFSYVRPILEHADVIWDNCYDYEREFFEKYKLKLVELFWVPQNHVLEQVVWIGMGCSGKKKVQT